MACAATGGRIPHFLCSFVYLLISLSADAAQHPLPQLNLITAPHSSDRWGRCSDLFTAAIKPSAEDLFPIPHPLGAAFPGRLAVAVPMSPQAARDEGQPGAQLRLPPTSAMGEVFPLCFFPQVLRSKRPSLGLMLFFHHVLPSSLGLAVVCGVGDISTPASAGCPQRAGFIAGLVLLLLGHRAPRLCKDQPWERWMEVSHCWGCSVGQ